MNIVVSYRHSSKIVDVSYNQLWRYSIVSGLWQFIAGSTATGVQSVLTQNPQQTVVASRTGHSSIYEESNDRLVVFAGYQGETKSFFADVWAFSFANMSWSLLAGNTTANATGMLPSQIAWMTDVFPGARYGHVMFYDWRAQACIVSSGFGFGGNGSLGKSH